jgi:hypothetical protein
MLQCVEDKRPEPMLTELLRATFEMGLPVAALSWLLFYRLYSRGVIARDADHKSIGETLKTIRQEHKESKEKPDSLVHANWMKFGTGFYGVAAAWTLICIEASGLFDNVMHPSNLLAMFHKDIGDWIGDKISDQVTTFVDAATWFSWWPGHGHSPVAWFVVAYVAYVAGLNLARVETDLGSRALDLDSRAWWRSLIPFTRPRVTVKEDDPEQLPPPG